MNYPPILMELEARHYQRELLREAAAYRLTRLLNVADRPPKKRNPVISLTKRFAVAFVALASAHRLAR